MFNNTDVILWRAAHEVDELHACSTARVFVGKVRRIVTIGRQNERCPMECWSDPNSCVVWNASQRIATQVNDVGIGHQNMSRSNC